MYQPQENGFFQEIMGFQLQRISLPEDIQTINALKQRILILEGLLEEKDQKIEFLNQKILSGNSGSQSEYEILKLKSELSEKNLLIGHILHDGDNSNVSAPKFEQ